MAPAMSGKSDIYKKNVMNLMAKERYLKINVKNAKEKWCKILKEKQ